MNYVSLTASYFSYFYRLCVKDTFKIHVDYTEASLI
jgi:hypothetical protein